MIITLDIVQVFENYDYYKPKATLKIRNKIDGFDSEKDTGIIIFGSYQQKIIPSAITALQDAGYKIVWQSPIAMNHSYGGESRNTVVVFEK